MTYSPQIGLHRYVQRGLAGFELIDLDVIGEIKRLMVADEHERSQRNLLTVPVLDEISTTHSALVRTHPRPTATKTTPGQATCNGIRDVPKNFL